MLRSPAVVDKWGYLWSGGGTYIKDFGGATGRKHILIRFNTQAYQMGLQYFPVDHETNVSACVLETCTTNRKTAGCQLLAA